MRGRPLPPRHGRLPRPPPGALTLDPLRARAPLLPSAQSYSAQLGGDPIVHAHLSALYDTLLEQNLIRWAVGCHVCCAGWGGSAVVVPAVVLRLLWR